MRIFYQTCGLLSALFLFTNSVLAQPSAVKNVSKSVFTLTTFKADGSLLASSHGVFIDCNGTAISDWSSFDGASSAVVVDAAGKKMEVTCIVGANEIYDVAKFIVAGKTTAAPVATTGLAEGSTAYLVGYAVKKPEITETHIDKVEKFMDKYSYYIIKQELPGNTQSCPLVNAAGQVIGFLQHSKYTTDDHSTDALYVAEMTSSGLSANDPVLRRTAIPTAIPDDMQQAKLALMIAGQGADSVKSSKVIDLFMQKFPDLPDGYYLLAEKAVRANDFDNASRQMETAIKKATDKDDAHFTYAKLIYQKEVYKSDIPYPAWSLDKAYEEAQKAYEVSPLPFYQHLQAQILYTKKEYQQAHDQFMALTKTNLRNPELFYEAAQCQKQLSAPKESILCLLDSAVNELKKPFTTEAAPYLIARARQLEEMGEYRKAIADYNHYDTLMAGHHSAEFFYQREQCEVKGKLFQQALNDIDTATRMAPGEPLYFAEKSSLLLRVNMKQEALEAAETSISLDPEYSEAYLLKGLAQIQLGNKKEGLQTLNKALELGNEQAPALIEKYK